MQGKNYGNNYLWENIKIEASTAKTKHASRFLAENFTI